MLTKQQAKEILDSLGISPPDVLIDAWLAVFYGLIECMELNGYDKALQLLILTHLITLYGISLGSKYISSQSAPSGASRSFRYNGLHDTFKSNLAMIRMLDKKGCTDGSLPPDPTKKNAALLVAKGGCYVGHR